MGGMVTLIAFHERKLTGSIVQLPCTFQGTSERCQGYCRLFDMPPCPLAAQPLIISVVHGRGRERERERERESKCLSKKVDQSANINFLKRSKLLFPTHHRS